ncbi:LOW QUALITY PROTEIN: mitochondrial amidoxime-reducing component 1-like [Eriocheir sinensis]|uniref:LOW QUALITY PROTEIN: mitochondrial amidoxime-reducing component 1-like n=1 Tax=Eriocheir sinensis TaxID=95602 RepID=UPI0021CA10A5|nr:LOW QUALITY PROTEIN: mitochondrial amidoxime-reducing component 1-like [Eriocheir sinensis]
MYYADTSAYNVASQSSLEDLNSRLAQPIEMKNFRPNIVICRAPPFAEDDWLYLKIGDAVFRKIKPCERCLLTTVDPKSYERDPNQNSLTLRTYRLIKDPPKLAKVWATKPVFGANMAIDIGGSISVGDKVFAATVSKNPSFSIFHDMD